MSNHSPVIPELRLFLSLNKMVFDSEPSIGVPPTEKCNFGKCCVTLTFDIKIKSFPNCSGVTKFGVTRCGN